MGKTEIGAMLLRGESAPNLALLRRAITLTDHRALGCSELRTSAGKFREYRGSPETRLDA
jgi:hypothetical protein